MVSCRNIRGDCKVEVALAVDGAVSDDGLDHLEGLGSVSGQGDLTRASTVRSSANNGDVALLAGGEGSSWLAGRGAQVALVALAGVV